MAWKILSKHSKFEDTFAKLGDTEDLDEMVMVKLEEFVCHLYGYREKSIVRLQMFEKKTRGQHKVPDLSTFPPCQSVFIYHCKRSNTIAYLWKQMLTNLIDCADISLNGWEQDGSIHWVDEHFPCEIEDILVQN